MFIIFVCVLESVSNYRVLTGQAKGSRVVRTDHNQEDGSRRTTVLKQVLLSPKTLKHLTLRKNKSVLMSFRMTDLKEQNKKA